jgi:hypothetical protein
VFFKLFPGYHVRDNLEIPGRGSKSLAFLYRGGVDIKCNKPIELDINGVFEGQNKYCRYETSFSF